VSAWAWFDGWYRDEAKGCTVYQGFAREKIIALNAGMTVIRLLPPLVITYEQIDHLVEVLTEVLRRRTMDNRPRNGESSAE
jgi:acetylornithine/succinyldiaminopimelate/putrescine aminotransferase